MKRPLFALSLLCAAIVLHVVAFPAAQSYLQWPLNAPNGGTIRTVNQTGSSFLIQAWNSATGAFNTLAAFTGGNPPTLEIAPFTLSASVWDDLVVPAVAVNPNGPDGSMTAITDGTGYLACLQADATGETLTAQFQVSHSMKAGSNLHPHVHYVKNDETDNVGTVTFQANYRHCPLTGTCGAWSGWTAGTATIVPADVADATGLFEWEIPWATYNFDISSLLLITIKRTAGTTGSVAVCSVDLHWERDSLGSTSEGAR